MEFKDLPLMEIICDKCKGTGNKNINEKYFARDCRNCKGHGKILTEFGQAIMKLVEDYNDFDEKYQFRDYHD